MAEPPENLLERAGLTSLVLDRLPVGVTVVDPDGRMLEAFKAGRREDFQYEARRGERRLRVTFSPLYLDGRLAAAIQTVSSGDEAA
ncbi:MAG: hypothetical protein AB1896_22145 [Thermodesulfobacteriota bacterium]